jgi:hypothetical protein
VQVKPPVVLEFLETEFELFVIVFIAFGVVVRFNGHAPHNPKLLSLA